MQDVITETIDERRIVPDRDAGRRLDQVAAELFASFSRSRLQAWIRAGALTVDGVPAARPRLRLEGGETLHLRVRLEASGEDRPEPIELEILHRDEAVLVVSKPPGLVVHPGAGNRAGTLVNALLHYDPDLHVLPRAGIIHRLDKDTSGALLVARTPGAHRCLVEAMQTRQIERRYEALVFGEMVAGGSVEAPIARHPMDRKRMAVVTGGRSAVTHYRLRARYRGITQVAVRLETGRTHQIRVHMAYSGYPVLGDPVYGGRGRVPAGVDESLREVIRAFPRQALHAERLAFAHPDSGARIEVNASRPADLQALIDALERSRDHE